MTIKAHTIRTTFVHPPIPDRSHDWSAVLDGYEPGDPIGYGPTEKEAIEDLYLLLAEADAAEHFAERFP